MEILKKNSLDHTDPLKINQFGNVDLRLQQIYKSRDNILNFYPVTKAY